MEHYAGIDVSLELSSVCVVDAQGKIVRETKVASEPEALVAFFASLGFAVKRIGLEAGPLSAWLHAGLKRAGFDTVLLETRHVKAALSAMMVKTDRKDARGLAQLIRMGWFRPVHAKSMGSQEVRALLVARKQLLGRLIDVELSIRGILRGFGLKVGVVTRKGFEGRIRELVTGHITLERIAGAMLSARATLKEPDTGRRLLRQRPNHPSGMRKDQTRHHQTATIETSVESRLISNPNKPEPPSLNSSDCPKPFEDGHCIDARHAKAALKMQINKSDRNDAVGIAPIMQCGWYKEVRVKDLDSHAVKALLASRALLVKRGATFRPYTIRHSIRV